MDPSRIPYHPARNRGLRIPMPPHPIAAEQARTLTQILLDNWELNPLKDNTLLAVSELVTNALKQRDVFLLALHRRGETALIEVTDTSLGLPTVKKANESDTNGRGLLLVEAVSDEWGLRYEENGRKTVWARIAK